MTSFTLTIDRLGGLGDGSGKHDGTPVFVSKSCVGDVLKVKETSRTKEAIRAEIVEILTPGPDRTPAPCPHYDACGGCSLQHISGESYQEFKRAVVTSALGYAGFPEVVPEFHFLPAATRRRADFKVEGGKLAYVSSKSHDRVAIASCLILLPELDALITPLNKRLPDFPHVTGLSMTRADSGIDLLLQVTSSEGGLEAYQDLAEALPIARLSVQWPSKSITSLAQTDMVLMNLSGHDVPIPADAFLQASAEAQALITERVVKATNSVSPVVDLFAGIGTYSFPMSARARVHAVDNNGPMIDHIRSISPKVSVDKRDLFLHPMTAFELAKYKAAVINPPRMGAAAQVKQLCTSGIPKIVMVSCNHATWSRDAKTLKAVGYVLQSLAAIDQFVYSPHVELVSIFSRA
ncbi:MAG: hypothetical protein SFX19_02435 [Alphaproteobacteria bacterium]|nr:hypothetical protein [Alphaproteobacteria bacterium]